MDQGANLSQAKAPVIVWFRRNLRLRDNAALVRAVDTGLPILPVYVHDDSDEGEWALGAASRWWLHHSLKKLAKELQVCGSRLIVCRGAARDVLLDLRDQTGAGCVFYQRRYEVAARKNERIITDVLTERFRQTLPSFYPLLENMSENGVGYRGTAGAHNHTYS